MKASIEVCKTFQCQDDHAVFIDLWVGHDFDGRGREASLVEDYDTDTETHAYLFASFAALVLEDEGYTVDLNP